MAVSREIERERERDDCLDMNNCNNRKASFVFNIKVVAMIKSFYFCELSTLPN